MQEEKYPMCEPQPAQIDCRIESCKYHINANCTNVAPAITLNPDGIFVCWSKQKKEKEQTTKCG